MELNRNQYFFIGLVVLLLGLQLLKVDNYVLNEDATQFLAEKFKKPAEGQALSLVAQGTGAQKVVKPPEWLGMCLIAVGAVLVLHSLAMPKPGG
jgi:hypothetical protein